MVQKVLIKEERLIGGGPRHLEVVIEHRFESVIPVVIKVMWLRIVRSLKKIELVLSVERKVTSLEIVQKTFEHWVKED